MRNNLIWHYFFSMCWYLFIPLCAQTHQPTEHHAILTSLRGKTLRMANITCACKSDTLMLFKAPHDTQQIIATLDYDPQLHTTHIPLKNVARINIPYPYAVWYYRHNHGIRKYDKYLLIEVTLQQESATQPTAYLIKHKTRIHGMRIRSGGSHPCSISLNAIKKIEFNRTTNMTEIDL